MEAMGGSITAGVRRSGHKLPPHLQSNRDLHLIHRPRASGMARTASLLTPATSSCGSRSAARWRRPTTSVVANNI